MSIGSTGVGGMLDVVCVVGSVASVVVVRMFVDAVGTVAGGYVVMTVVVCVGVEIGSGVVVSFSVVSPGVVAVVGVAVVSMGVVGIVWIDIPVVEEVGVSKFKNPEKWIARMITTRMAKMKKNFSRLENRASNCVSLSLVFDMILPPFVNMNKTILP